MNFTLAALVFTLIAADYTADQQARYEQCLKSDAASKAKYEAEQAQALSQEELNKYLAKHCKSHLSYLTERRMYLAEDGSVRWHDVRLPIPPSIAYDCPKNGPPGARGPGATGVTPKTDKPWTPSVLCASMRPLTWCESNWKGQGYSSLGECKIVQKEGAT